MDELGELTLIEWVQERYDNCQEIACTKTGKDREGWLEDGRYFGAILQLLIAADGFRPHIARGGKSPYEKRFSIKDVEAMVGVTLALYKSRALSAGEQR